MFQPNLTLKNNCFLLITFTTEGSLILLHSSTTVLLSKNSVIFCKGSYIFVNKVMMTIDCSFGNRNNVRAPLQFNRESQP